MKRTSFFTVLTALLFFLFSGGCKKQLITPKYMKKEVPVEQRVQDLLRRMTLEEKIRQMDMWDAKDLTTNKLWDDAKIAKVIGSTGIGAVHDLYPEDIEMVNMMQRYAVEHSRLHIPILFIEEALHGYLGRGATVFPQAIALASTWDTSLVREIGHAIAQETRSHGVEMVLSPVLGLARDPRWGRVEETYGEDPWLAAMTGLAMVRGLQGDTLAADDAVVAEPKHFGVHSIPEAGANTSPVNIGEREARSSFLKVFETAVRQGGALGIMAAYHELDGIPSVANRWLLTDVLRREWGFRGFVLSDLGAIAMLQNTHHTAATAGEALIQAVAAGTDMQFYDYDHEIFLDSLKRAVEEGRLPMEAVDRAAASVLRVKFLLGLFDDPYTDTSLVRKRFATPAHKKLALQAAREGVVLLKNEGNVLPFGEEVKTLAVIGPMAHKRALGDYTPKGARMTTVLEGLTRLYGGKVRILYAPGLLPKKIFTVVPTEVLMPEVAVAGKKGLTARYYANDSLARQPAVTRTETINNPYWGTGSPAGGVPADHFSVSWSGTLTPKVSGTYEFALITDDKGRLYLDGKLLIDNWDPYEVNRMKTCRVELQAGHRYPLRVEYAEEEGFAGIRFLWRMVSAEGKTQQEYISKAVEAAQRADAVVMVMGEGDDVVGEGRDKALLEPDADEVRLLERVAAVKKPLAVVLLSGRPLALEHVAGLTPALLEAWFPGQEGGTAIAEILFGKVSPSGKLPVTFPRSAGQLPFYYDHKPSSTHRYVDEAATPLYPFGYGLTYSRFSVDSLKVPAAGRVNEPVPVRVTVTNRGDREATEVVQVYVTDKVSSVTTPVKRLAAFRRVTLAPGASATLHFRLTRENLGLWNQKMEYVVEPGRFRVTAGFSSQGGLTAEFLLH